MWLKDPLIKVITQIWVQNWGEAQREGVAGIHPAPVDHNEGSLVQDQEAAPSMSWFSNLFLSQALMLGEADMTTL